MAINMSETQRNVEKTGIFSDFSCLWLSFGKKYLDHKDFSLNVKKNPLFLSYIESSFWRVTTRGRHDLSGPGRLTQVNCLLLAHSNFAS
jgi:hypothetical protein